MLAKAVGQALTKHIHDLLEQIFIVQFTETVRQALVDISIHIQPLLPVIQNRLLNYLSLVLTGNGYKEGGISTDVSPILTAAIRELQVNDSKDVYAYVLALNTLGTFDFTGTSLPFSIVLISVRSYVE